LHNRTPGGGSMMETKHSGWLIRFGGAALEHGAPWTFVDAEHGEGRLGGIPHVQGTKEYLTCIAGERFRVEQGDVLAFPGDQQHSYQNSGTRTAVCLSVVVLAPVGIG
jgi:hypothetical protein